MEKALIELLTKASNEYAGKELLVLDIGIFPWFNSIEVSLLFSEDQCDLDDIVSWPHYNYSNYNEGGWSSASSTVERLSKEWEKNSDIVSILKQESLVLRLPSVKKAISKFSLANNFTVQLLNSDDSSSPNYCV